MVMYVFSANMVFANPTGYVRVHGSVTVETAGNTLTVTNTPNSIITWQGFSINANEITKFVQENAASAVLNRVVGQDPSAILGGLSSNGRVFLINPNGILFGQEARIDVNGLVASTLGLSNQDFLDGRYNFSAGAVARGITIEKDVQIKTPAGGHVYLIAPDIQNSGLIESPKGDILLAAGRSVQLVDSADPFISVVVSAPEDRAVNLGTMMANSGRVGIFGGLISQQGTVRADSAVVGENGKILFKATKSIALEAGSVTSAGGLTGGTVTVDSGDGATIVSGTVTAAASEGPGGTILFEGSQFIISGDGTLATNGGDVTISADRMTLGNTIDAGTAGTVTLSPFTAGRSIDLIDLAANKNANAYSLELSNEELNRVKAGTLAVGGATGGVLSVKADLTPSSANIGNMELLSMDDILFDADKKIDTTGPVNVTVKANSEGYGSGSIVMNSGSGIYSHGGNITLTGGKGGKAYSFSMYADGVLLDGAKLDAGGGDISIMGAGYDYPYDQRGGSGVRMTAGTIAQTSETGAISIGGYGGYGGYGGGHGLDIAGASLTAGSLNLMGTGGENRDQYDGSYSGGHGIALSAGSQVVQTSTEGEGSLFLIGFGGSGNGGTGGAGVSITGESKVQGAANSALTVAGYGGFGGYGGGHGLDIAGASQVISPGTITLVGKGGDNGALDYSGSYSGGHGITLSGGSQVVQSSPGDQGALSLTGTGGETVGGGYGGYGVVVDKGSSLKAAGSITIAGTGGYGGYGGGTGIGLYQESIVDAAGNITLIGTGGDAGYAYESEGGTGIALHGESTVRTTGSGTATITGTGGGASASSGGTGVLIAEESVVQAAGNIEITGTGGGGDYVRYGGTGVNIDYGSTVEAAGDITLTGTGGGGNHVESGGIGLSIDEASAVKAAGNIAITGTGGSPGEDEDGSGGTGIYIGGGSLVQSGDTGGITLQGKGGSDVYGNGYGIEITNGSQIRSTGTGPITLDGQGGGWEWAGDIEIYNSQVASGGDISIKGHGGEFYLHADEDQPGPAAIAATGSGSIRTTSDSSFSGIWVDRGRIASENGNIDLTAASQGYGYGGRVESTGTGNVTLTATGADGIQFGYFSETTPNNGFVSAASGDITLSADRLTIYTGSTIQAPVGTVQVKPYTEGTRIDLGEYAQQEGLVIDGTILNALTAKKIHIGDGNSGDLTVSGPVSHDTAETLVLETGADLYVNNDITKSSGDDAFLSLKARGNVNIQSGAGDVGVRIGSTSNKLHVTLNADSDGAGGGAIVMNPGSVIDSNGGNIVLGGGADPNTMVAKGTEAVNIGVHLDGATLNSGAGDITIRGQGGDNSQGNNNIGILIEKGSQVKSSTGTITLEGTGGAGVDGNVGVSLSESLIQSGVSASSGGGIAITGTGSGSGAFNYGIRSEVASIHSLGEVPIILTGAGSGTTPVGISLSSLGSQLCTVGGAEAHGNITLAADKMDLRDTIRTTGTVAVKTKTTGGTIGIDLNTTGGDAAVNTLELSQAELDYISAGTLRIGDAGAGALTVTNDIDLRDTVPTVKLTSGASIGGTGKITDTHIALVGGTGIDVKTGANSLAASAGSGGITIVNTATSGTLAISAGGVDGVAGIDSRNTAISLTETVGNVTVDGAVNAGSGPLATTLDGRGKGLTLNAAIAGNGIALTADNMSFDGVSASISGGKGRVILAAKSADTAIKVGGAAADVAGSAAVLGLSQAELNKISTLGGITIGSLSNTGGITVVAGGANLLTGTILGPTIFQTGKTGSTGGSILVTGNLTTPGDLTLDTRGEGSTYGSVTGGGRIEVNAGQGVLNVNASTGIDLTNPGNNVRTVHLNNDDSGDIAYKSNIGADDTLTVDGSNIGPSGGGRFIVTEGAGNLTVSGAGIETKGGDVTLTGGAGRTLTIDTGSGVDGTGGEWWDAGVIYQADRMVLNGPTHAGTGGNVTLKPFSPDRPVYLGTESTADALGLSGAMLTTVTADTLTVGSKTSGELTVTADLDLSAANIQNLHLVTDDKINVNNKITTGGRSFSAEAASFTLGAEGNEKSIDTSGNSGRAGGDVTITMTGEIDLHGEIMAKGGSSVAGEGHHGGSVFLKGSSIATGAIDASGSPGMGPGYIGGYGGSISLTAGGITLSGDLTARGDMANPTDVGGEISLTGPVTLGANVIIDNRGFSADRSIYFSDTLDAAHSKTESLTLLSSGDITLGGAVGDTTPLNTFTIGAAHDVYLSSITASSISLHTNASDTIFVLGDRLALTTDQLSLDTSVNATGSDVVLTSLTPDKAIVLGSGESSSGFNLSNDVLKYFTTDRTLTIGGVGHTGRIEADGAVDLTAGGLTGGLALATSGGDIDLSSHAVSTPVDLSLTTRVSGTEVTGRVTGSGVFTVGQGGDGSLTVSAAKGIFLENPENLANDVSFLNSTSGDIIFKNNRSMTLGAANLAPGGKISVTNAAGTLNITVPVSTMGPGTGDIFLQTAGAMTIDEDVTAGESGTVNLIGSGITNQANIMGPGGVTLTADKMDLESGSVNSPSGTVGLSARTAIGIDLGSTQDTASGKLELSDTELDTIMAGTLRIGKSDGGAIDISAPIDPANADTLSLISGSTIGGSGTVTADSLAFEAGGAVNLTTTVSTLAGSTTAGGITVMNTMGSGLTVGAVDGKSGLSSVNSAIYLTETMGHVTTAAPVNAGSGAVAITLQGTEKKLTNNGTITGLGGVTLVADKMTLAGGSVRGGSNTVELKSYGAGGVDLGATSDTAMGKLELSDAELDTITAAILRVGKTGGGAIAVSDAIHPANADTLSLLSGSTIGGTGTVTAEKLAFAAGGAVNLTTIVSTLAGSTSGGGITISNTIGSGLTVGAVDGKSGLSGGNGAVNLTETVGNITVGAYDVSTSGGAISLTASGAGKAIDSVAGSNIVSNGGAVTLVTDKLGLGGTIAAGTGLVTIEANDRAREIRIGAGAADGSGVLAINDQELLKIHGSGGLTIGRGDQTGTVTVAGAADAANLTGGTLVLQSGTGDIAVNGRLTSPVDARIQTAGGNIGFGSAGAISAAGKAVKLNAAGGSVSGNGANLTNVTAAALDVIASTGIGHVNPLETSVGTLTFMNTTNGVQVTNINGSGLTVSGTNAGTGLVKITEDGGGYHGADGGDHDPWRRGDPR